MTLPSTPRRAGPFYGDGSATQFPFAFKTYARTDIQFVVALPSGDVVTLALDVDYIVTLNVDQANTPGGYVSYPISGTPLESGGVAAIGGSLDYGQPTALPEGGSYRARNVETMADRIVMLVQQVAEAQSRSFTFPLTEGVIPEFPPIAQRAGRLLGFDDAGQFVGVLPAPGSATTLALDLANTTALGKGDALIGVKQPFTGSIARTQHDKNSETWSLQDAGGAVAGTAAANAAAAAVADATGRTVFLPFGTYSVSGSYAFTQRYYGPGSFAYSGIGAATFAGSGLNDATFGGTYNGTTTLALIVKINATGAPDTLAYSVDGGATFVTTQDIYNPGTDSYVTGPIPITAGAIAIWGTGATVAFGATTGHTAGATWSLTLRPTPLVLETTGRSLWMNGQRAMAIYGNSCFIAGNNVSGDNKSVGSQIIAVGDTILNKRTTGFALTAVGANVMPKVTTGRYMTAVGTSVMTEATDARECVAMGVYTLGALTTGDGDNAYGVDAGRYCTTGVGNNYYGRQSGYQNQTGSYCVGFGEWALRGGSSSLPSGTSCNFSTALGAKSGYMGSGDYNVFVGFEAGFKATGSENTVIGADAGFNLVSGTANTFIGRNAGANASQKADAQNQVLLGDNTYGTGNNAIAIGSGAAAAANEIVLGNAFNTVLRVATDNTINLGSGAKRMATIFAGTGAINTSDEREKEQFRVLSAAERRIALAIKGSIRAFKFSDAVEKKGSDARWHYGVGAQTVAAAFQAEGLDPSDYGLFCYDEWTETAAGPAGNRYGLRYDELAMFVLSAI